ncbi:MAG TPA: L,D-transpeptidase family protein [Ferruginibacter sp.]|nr:L,D-transpeptidase family protein [Ferruginibacter sp.]
MKILVRNLGLKKAFASNHTFTFMKDSFKFYLFCFFSLVILMISCKAKDQKEKQVLLIEDMNNAVEASIEKMLDNANSKGKINDSISLSFLPVVKYYYNSNENKPVWSNKEEWNSIAGSLIHYLDTCERDGLFPETYQITLIKKLQLQLADSSNRKIASTWGNSDLLLTDAFFQIIQHLKQGRLQADSLEWKYSKQKQELFFAATLNQFKDGKNINELLLHLQPSIKNYSALKMHIPSFLDSMDRKAYTYLKYPFKDSIEFQRKLLQRLGESGFTISEKQPDTTMLQSLIKKYQKVRKLKETGKISAALITQLNNTDKEKFKRIAITLDRYKQLPNQMPEKYIWVNLPAYNLKVWNNDTLALESKVIVGKPVTPTPFINSAISDIIVYPTWTIPNSIIVKEILPALKKNAGYLARKGYGLYTYDGKPIDPYSVNWAKYSKGIPYLVRQGSGDNNALGIIKFNFPNEHSVYLHDTNQRYLFKNSQRSLSHGCVRVQEWEKLARYIIQNDSMLFTGPDSLRLSTDSVAKWIERKERHTMVIKQKMPVFIRYFSVEDVNGVIKFYDDIYGDDKRLRERYLSKN